MATRTLTTCDVHGDETQADETLRFAIRDDQYEIDLCTEHARELDEAFTRFVDAGARRAKGAPPPVPRRGAGRAPTATGEREKIRVWAKKQGLAISDRGRIPKSVVDAYQNRRRRRRAG